MKINIKTIQMHPYRSNLPNRQMKDIQTIQNMKMKMEMNMMDTTAKAAVKAKATSKTKHSHNPNPVLLTMNMTITTKVKLQQTDPAMHGRSSGSEIKAWLSYY